MLKYNHIWSKCYLTFLMITYSVFQYMINDNVIFRAHKEQLVQDNPLNVEDRHKAEFPLWFEKKVSNLKT